MCSGDRSLIERTGWPPPADVRRGTSAWREPGTLVIATLTVGLTIGRCGRAPTTGRRGRRAPAGRTARCPASATPAPAPSAAWRRPARRWCGPAARPAWPSWSGRGTMSPATWASSWSSPPTSIGTIATIGDDGSSSWASSHSRSAPAHTAMTTSFTVVPAARLMAMIRSRGSRVIATRRCRRDRRVPRQPRGAPPDRGRRGPGRWSGGAGTGRADRAPACGGRSRPTCRRGRRAAPRCRGGPGWRRTGNRATWRNWSTGPSKHPPDEVRSLDGRLRLDVALPAGSGSSRRGHHLGAGDAVDRRHVDLGVQGDPVVAQPVDDPQLPQWSGAVERDGVQAGDQAAERGGVTAAARARCGGGGTRGRSPRPVPTTGGRARTGRRRRRAAPTVMRGRRSSSRARTSSYVSRPRRPGPKIDRLPRWRGSAGRSIARKAASIARMCAISEP